jgi:hypothetical protein
MLINDDKELEHKYISEEKLSKLKKLLKIHFGFDLSIPDDELFNSPKMFQYFIDPNSVDDDSDLYEIMDSDNDALSFSLDEGMFFQWLLDTASSLTSSSLPPQSPLLYVPTSK